MVAEAAVEGGPDGVLALREERERERERERDREKMRARGGEGGKEKDER